MTGSIGLDATTTRLPLVSVVVVNFNYAPFLEEAVASVYAQSYPVIECVVVDNASTDSTPACLDRLTRRHPDLKVIRRTTNGGQSIACKDGFEATSGRYVVFLDADDFLLDRCIEAHVFTQLSLRTPVGFTSVDMYQTVDGQTVVSTSPGFGAFVASGEGRKAAFFRPIDEQGVDGWPLHGARIVEADRVHLVPPARLDPWVWSPTSGNCFRRDALRLFLNNEAFGAMRSGTDAYLARGVSGLCGSALIDRPLACYRLHGANVFTLGAPLVNVATYSPQRAADNTATAMRALIDHMFAQQEEFVARLPSPYTFGMTMRAIAGAWPPLPSTTGRYRTYAAERAATDIGRFRKAWGTWPAIRLLELLGMFWPRIAWIVMLDILRTRRRSTGGKA